MTSKAAIFALLSLWGVGTVACLPAVAQEGPPATESSADSDDADDLTDRVWVRAGDEAALPGVIKIFLSDGTLVQDSCWETHRLSAWQKAGANAVSWNEDGMEIRADIVTLSADELVLKIAGMDAERYTPAIVPYVCPDIPRS
ncbi:MAG: hypothetical protein ABIY37_16565 [Devosia sp.]